MSKSGIDPIQSQISKRYIKSSGTRLSQGDIFSDVEFPISAHRLDEKGDEVIEETTIEFPYVILMTQDCDLEQDYFNRIQGKKTQDKYLHSVLVCPAYLAEQFKKGDHLADLEIKMESWNSDRYGLIAGNQNPRFHFLVIDQSMHTPNLIIDFKHYYTISRDDLYSIAKTNYLCTLNQLFREQLSQRFSQYLSRVGTPELCVNLLEEKEVKGSVDTRSLEA